MTTSTSKLVNLRDNILGAWLLCSGLYTAWLGIQALLKLAGVL